MLDDRLVSMRDQKSSLLDQLEECRKELISTQNELGTKEEELKRLKMDVPKIGGVNRQLNTEMGRSQGAKAQVDMWRPFDENHLPPKDMDSSHYLLFLHHTDFPLSLILSHMAPILHSGQ